MESSEERVFLHTKPRNIMKILLYATPFAQITNGPAKFAHALLRAANCSGDIALKILTESKLPEPMEQVYPVPDSSWLSRIRLPMGKVKFSMHHHRNIHNFLKTHPHWKPDYVIFNDGCSGVYSSVIGIGKAKIVLMVNDYHYAAALVEGWWKNRKQQTYVYHYLLEKIAVRHADLVFANSIFLENLIIRKYGIAKKNITNNYQGVEACLLAKSLKQEDTFFDKNQQGIQMTFVKSDAIIGGLQELIGALALLKQYRFELTIIGPFSNPKITLGYDVPENTSINYLGPQAQAKVYDQMQHSHIFCTPSRKEALGIANMEALALGTTVVSTRVGGIPEVLADGNNGYLASECSPRAIAEAIKTAIEDSPENRQRKRQAGKAWVLTHFNQEQLVGQFFETLRKAL